jgi:hypothetical protein
MKESTKARDFVKKPLEERTDRELEMTKIILQRKANKSLESISNNIKFFFYLTLLVIAVSIIVYIVMESNS